MEGLKKIVNILVMVYLVAAALIYLNILNVGQQTNPGFYTTFFLVGGVLMLLELLVENLYIAVLKRSHAQNNHKINELKANLYDQKQELQNIKTKQAEETVITAPVTHAPFTPGRISNSGPTVTPVADTPDTTTAAPLTAAPVGSEPVPHQGPPTDPFAPKPDVIITPRPEPGHNPEPRRTDHSDF